MKHCSVALVVVSVLAAGSLIADDPAKSTGSAELHAARVAGWQLVEVIAKTLEAGDQTNFPGIAAWLKDYRDVAKGIDATAPADKWPAIDVDALVTHNGNFWQAYFEVAPGDPGLILLQAGLLLSAGEADRANYLATLAGQRPGVPAEFLTAFESVIAHSSRLRQKSGTVLQPGIQLHDKGDYAGALAKYQAALDLWPQYGLVHYEIGLTKYYQHLAASGKKLPQPNAIQVNGGDALPQETIAAYALARRHDPLQMNAYQGGDKELLAGLVALARQGLPVWQKIGRNRKQAIPDGQLEQLAAACQTAQYDEFALAARQILVARRGGYLPADHPFITTSLKRLAPGKPVNTALERLAGGKTQVRQLVAPEPVK